MRTTTAQAPADRSLTIGDDTSATTTPPRHGDPRDDVFAHGPRLAATGITFDVISVDAPLGLAALRLLREREVPLGAVIHDERWGRIGYLVPPRTDEPDPDDEPGGGPRRIGLGAWVVVPPDDSYATVTWLRPPAAAGHLTPTGIVWDALREAATTLGEAKPRT
ncbi:hypothetical protein [Embleya hyalina]|uniref:Uncharacterized protein n=1 Tax=Embleya hyalina TaxID=516124 RepID=A0A401YN96_9ACTN|nr:hypothetical protein [Embleya hyalina]GCD96047.1 hypothetical protein EHYA_03731 [Embleya hyalina]